MFIKQDCCNISGCDCGDIGDFNAHWQSWRSTDDISTTTTHSELLMSTVLPTKNIPQHKKEYDNVFETIYQLSTHPLMEKAC